MNTAENEPQFSVFSATISGRDGECLRAVVTARLGDEIFKDMEIFIMPRQFANEPGDFISLKPAPWDEPEKWGRPEHEELLFSFLNSLLSYPNLGTMPPARNEQWDALQAVCEAGFKAAIADREEAARGE